MAYTPEAKRTPHTFLHHQRGSSNPFDSSSVPPFDSSFSTPLRARKSPPHSSTPRQLQLDEKPKPEKVVTNPFGDDKDDEEEEEVPVAQDGVDQGQTVSALQEDTVEQEEEKNEQEENTSPLQTPSSLKPTESTSTLKTDDNGLESVTAQHVEGIKHQMSTAFRQELLATLPLKTDSRIGLEVAKLSDPDLNVIQLFGRCLPYVVPNVILAKREVRQYCTLGVCKLSFVC